MKALTMQALMLVKMLQKYHVDFLYLFLFPFPSLWDYFVLMCLWSAGSCKTVSNLEDLHLHGSPLQTQE